MLPKVIILAFLAIDSGLSRAATHVGRATFYHPGLGACGVVSKDSDFITAIAAPLFNSFCHDCNSNKNPACGRKMTVTAPNGKSVEVTVLDACEGCGENDVDLSPAAFEKLADLSVGVINRVKWDL